MVLYRSLHQVYENFVDSRVFIAEVCIAMRVVPSHTPSVQSATRLPRMCTKRYKTSEDVYTAHVRRKGFAAI